jgi:capsid protein
LISVRSKQEALQEFLNRITVWRLNKFIADGVLTLPQGWMLSDLNFSWIPCGVPWWSPDKDVASDIMAIDACLKTRTEVRKANFGDSWKDVITKLKQEQEFMSTAGVVIKSPPPPPIPADPIDTTDGTTEINDLPNSTPAVN